MNFIHHHFVNNVKIARSQSSFAAVSKQISQLNLLAAHFWNIFQALHKCSSAISQILKSVIVRIVLQMFTIRFGFFKHFEGHRQSLNYFWCHRFILVHFLEISQKSADYRDQSNLANFQKCCSRLIVNFGRRLLENLPII